MPTAAILVQESVLIDKSIARQRDDEGREFEAKDFNVVRRNAGCSAARISPDYTPFQEGL